MTLQQNAPTRIAVRAILSVGITLLVCGTVTAQSPTSAGATEAPAGHRPLTMMTEEEKRQELQRILSRLEAPQQVTVRPMAADDPRTLWNGSGNRKGAAAPMAAVRAPASRVTVQDVTRALKETAPTTARTFSAPPPEDALGRLQRNQRILTQQRIDDIVIIESNR